MKKTIIFFLLSFNSMIGITNGQVITEPFLSDSYYIRVVTDDCSSLLTQDFYQEILNSESFLNDRNEAIIFNIDIDQNILFNVTHGFLSINHLVSQEYCDGNIFVLNKLLELRKSRENIYILGSCNFNSNISQFENLSHLPFFDKVFDSELIEIVKVIASKKYRNSAEMSSLLDFVHDRFNKLDNLSNVDKWDLYYAKTILGKVLFGNDYFNSEWQSFIIEKVHKHLSFASYSNQKYTNDIYSFFNIKNTSIFLNSCEVKAVNMKKVVKNKNCFNQSDALIKFTQNTTIPVYDGRHKKYVQVSTGINDYSYKKGGRISN